MSINKYLLIFIGVAMLGWYLRVSAALTQDFWMDEVSIFHVARNNSLWDLMLVNHWDKSHPQLFYILIHYWQMMSTKAFFLRIPSLLAFLPTVFLIYRIGIEVRSAKLGLGSAFIFAVHPFFVNLGFQQKQYALSFFCVFLCIYFSLKAWKSAEKKYLWLSSAATILGFYVDYSFLWFALSWYLSLWIGGIFFDRSQIKRLLIISLGSILGVSLHIPIFLRDFHKALDLEKYLGETNLETVKSGLVHFSGLFILTPHDKQTSYYLLITSTAIAALILWKAKKTVPKLFALFLILGFFLTIVSSYVISQHSPIFVFRNLFVAAFLFIFMPAWVLTKKWPDQRLLFMFSVVLKMLVAIYILLLSYQSLIKFEFTGSENFKALLPLLDQSAEERTVLTINLPEFMVTAFMNYYLLGFASDEPNYETQNHLQITTTMDLDNLDQLKKIPLTQHIVIFAEKDFMDQSSSAKQNILDTLSCNTKTCLGPFPIRYDRLSGFN